MSHTEGKLQLVIRNVAIADTGDYEGVCEAKSEAGKIMFSIWGDDDIDEANARRLVATWNGLTDFSTKVIEEEFFPGMLRSMRQERDELRDERDELLEVLTLCDETMKDIWPEYQHIGLCKIAESILARYQEPKS